MNIDITKQSIRAALKMGKVFAGPEDFYEREIAARSSWIGEVTKTLIDNVAHDDKVVCKQAWVELRAEGVL